MTGLTAFTQTHCRAGDLSRDTLDGRPMVGIVTSSGSVCGEPTAPVRLRSLLWLRRCGHRISASLGHRISEMWRMLGCQTLVGCTHVGILTQAVPSPCSAFAQAIVCSTCDRRDLLGSVAPLGSCAPPSRIAGTGARCGALAAQELRARATRGIIH
eukprot:15453586-Alexandrium_andersonii.AAC.1